MPDSLPRHSADLASINGKIIADGETFPIVKLKDGTGIQTGTVATMLHNVGLDNGGAHGDVESELTLAIPTLVKVGLFDLFSPEEWISADNSGRRFIGLKAQEYPLQKNNARLE